MPLAEHSKMSSLSHHVFLALGIPGIIGIWLIDAEVRDAVTEEPVTIVYSVRYDDIPIGHLTQSAFRTSDHLLVSQLLEYRLSEGRVSRIQETLTFELSPPYRLLQAQQDVGLVDSESRITRRLLGNHIETDDREHHRLSSPFTFLDTPFFGHEAQLNQTEFDTRTIAFREARVVDSHWLRDVKNSTTATPTFRNPANGATLVLDHEGLVNQFIGAGKIGLHRALSGADAQVWRESHTLLPNRNIEVETMGIPQDYPTHASASLRFKFDDGRDSPWQPTLDDDAILTLNSRPNPVAAIERESYRQRHNAVDLTPELDALISETNELDSPKEKVALLIDGVRSYLKYVDNELELNVPEIVNSRLGDCSEHAKLFTHLAVESGLPARTVIGLKYVEATRTFRPHAWNEVAIDGEWHGIDPTLGKQVLNLGYIPFPAEDTIAMLRSLSGLKIEFVETI